MINKEKITALLCLLILMLGIFNLLGQFNNLPKVPTLVVGSEFEAVRMDPAQVQSQVGTARYLDKNWVLGSILRDPWQEMGLWKIPPLEEIPQPASPSSQGYVVPVPWTPAGFVSPSPLLQKEFPKEVDEPEADPASNPKKEEEKKEGEKKPDEKKEGEKKPDEKKPEEKKPDGKKEGSNE